MEKTSARYTIVATSVATSSGHFFSFLSVFEFSWTFSTIGDTCSISAIFFSSTITSDVLARSFSLSPFL